ncbi:MAG TPA: amino acid adenylation domain-containing protein [Gaiellaceae bacterium]|jgi:amino acid adenylation domain-containing protein
MQAGLLYEALSGRSGTYVQQVVVTCREPVDADALRRAWLEVIRRHGALRTSFIVGESAQPRQRIHEEVEVGINVLDWRGVAGDERERRWHELLVADRETGFEPAHAPLLRVVICAFERAETRVLWTYHHAILDGRSRRVVLQELFELYDHEVSGKALDWSPPPPFEQFAEWAATRGSDPEVEAFWREALAGVTEATPAPGSTPSDGLRNTSSLGMPTIERRFDSDLSGAVRAAATAHDLTPATILQGAYGLLLAQEADTDDLLFGTTRAGRGSAPVDARAMVGLLMVTGLVRLRVDPDEPVTRWLGRVREVNLAMREFEHVPLGELRRWCRLPRNGPLVETMFNFDRTTMNTVLRASDPAWESRDVRLIEQLEFPFTIDVLGDEQIAVTALFDESHVPAEEAARVLDRYEAIVRGCVERTEATVASVRELDPPRRKQLSGELEDESWVAAAKLAPTRIAEQILRVSDRIALEHGDRRVTYAELGSRADELAARLARLGAGHGTIVGIALARTPDLVCTLLAVHRVGAAYVPLDPRYPTERLAFMLDDSGASIVVTDERSSQALPAPASCAVLFADDGLVADRSFSPRSVSPDDLSHLIYTSGSTGTPKAVMIEHRSVAQLTAWAERTFDDSERDGMLASTSLSFDLSVFELLTTLALGGRIVLVDDVLALSDPEFRHEVAFVNSVPSALSQLLLTGPLPTTVRTVALAGEALPGSLVERLYAHASVSTVWNLYGPAEDTTYSTAHRCVSGQRPLIGRPLPGTRAYVVDHHLRPVPVGVAGELVLGGRGVARGYLDRAELTAERFRSVTFTGGEPERVYRTGDRARWIEGGALDYLGRLDDQVKIRGIRVEPGELAQVLREQVDVDDAAVVAQGDGVERKLVAYVVGVDGTPPDLPALREELAARLPSAFLPSAIVVLGALPVTTNGKLDRRALPDPTVPLADRGDGTLSDPTQRALAEIWRELLKVAGPISGGADFFELGGDSLSALELLVAVEDRFGRRLSVGTFLSATRLAEQAAAIETARAEPPTSTLIPLRSTGTRRPWICVLTDQRGVIGLRNVMPAMLSNQPVFAMQAVDLGVSSWRRSTIEEIAGACVRSVQARHPEGPYRLGGHSMGGLVAFAMAGQLVAAGHEVELLVLLDTSSPEMWSWPGRIAARDRALRGKSLVRRARGQANLARNVLRNASARARGERALLEWPRGFDDPWDQAGAYRLSHRYRPTKLASPVTVLYTAETLAGARNATLGWDRHVAGAIATRVIPGDHVSIFNEPDVRGLAAAIRDELDALG